MTLGTFVVMETWRVEGQELEQRDRHMPYLCGAMRCALALVTVWFIAS